MLWDFGSIGLTWFVTIYCSIVVGLILGATVATVATAFALVALVAFVFPFDKVRREPTATHGDRNNLANRPSTSLTLLSSGYQIIVLLASCSNRFVVWELPEQVQARRQLGLVLLRNERKMFLSILSTVAAYGVESFPMITEYAVRQLRIEHHKATLIDIPQMADIQLVGVI